MHWWQGSGRLVAVTCAVAVCLGLLFGVLTTPRGGLLVAGSVLAVVGVLVLSAQTMRGSEQILERQIRDRHRDRQARDRRARGSQFRGRQIRGRQIRDRQSRDRKIRDPERRTGPG